MSASTITDEYYKNLQISRHIGMFVSSFSLIFISFIIGKWANIWSWFWPGGYKIRAIGDCVDGIGEGNAQTLIVHKNGVYSEFHHVQLNLANDMHEVVVEQSTQDYLEQKWYKFHHLHGFASSCLLIAYVLSFLAVSIGVIDDKSTVHTRIFVTIVVFKKIPQVITTLLCSCRNAEVRDGAREIFIQRQIPDGRARKIGGFCFSALLIITAVLGILEIYSFWSCHAENNWDSRGYNESKCVYLSHYSEIANAVITAVTAITVDMLFLSNIGNVVPGVYGRRKLVILNTFVALILIAVMITNIFKSDFVPGYYAEVFYIAFLQYTTYMLSFSGN